MEVQKEHMEIQKETLLGLSCIMDTKKIMDLGLIMRELTKHLCGIRLCYINKKGLVELNKQDLFGSNKIHELSL